MFCVTLTPRSRVVKGQIMYFLVNASFSKPLDIETSNFAGAYGRSHDVEGTLDKLRSLYAS